MKKEFTVEDIDSIDRNDLQEEWLKQPAMYRYFATVAEDANTEADRLETRVKVVDAEIEKELRRNAEMNEAKVTEKSLASDVLNSEVHQKAVEEAINARHDARVLNNANVRALDHRKKALENLVQLELNGYNASPREPRNVKERIAERAADKHQLDAIDKKSKKRR